MSYRISTRVEEDPTEHVLYIVQKEYFSISGNNWVDVNGHQFSFLTDATIAMNKLNDE
jgi:hypothetical protein